MFVLQPDPYLLPTFRISPFRTVDVGINNTLPENNSIEAYFKKRFNGRQYQYTLNGREAIFQALRYYQLGSDDVVTILTTTGNFYISTCVTEEVEKFCKWSRQIEKNTKVLILNHEFGFPCKELGELIKTGIPIIEDCAHSFFSKDSDNYMGTVGDFVVYSFPKMFPIQIGGLLVSDFLDGTEKSNQLSDTNFRHIRNVLSHYVESKEDIINRRIENYHLLSKKFESLGFSARFQLDEGVVPGVFMFRTGLHSLDLPELKKHLYAHGIQCSVFYGEEAFFIPVHQALSEQDMDYFVEVFKSFIQ